MRIAIAIAIATVGLAAAPAAAQYPYTPAPAPLNYLPNFYNRTSQPLSPYLNLLRGGNTGVNYYYGVRPGTPAGGMTPSGTPAAGMRYGPQTQFLPQAATVVDPAGPPIEPGGREVTLRPAGHPVVFGNTFNGHGSYFSVFGATGVRGQQQGASGLGQSPRPGVRR